MFIEMCPPLLSDSLNIECSYNGKDANCSNLAIPETIAIPSCKTSYGIKTKQLELHCQYDGMWDKELSRCEPGNTFFDIQTYFSNLYLFF